MNINDKSSRNCKHTIPVQNLRMDVIVGDQPYIEEVMPGEIDGLQIFHKAYAGENNFLLAFDEDHATFFLILKGSGLFTIEQSAQNIEEASILLPPHEVNQASLRPDKGQTLHLLVFTKKYSANDKENLSLQEDPLDELFYTKFKDCKPYIEKIKSPNTVSRTVLPGDVIPRLALGTVEAKGPDKVGAHSHPMLEQLFLGLSENNITVFADDAEAEMKAFSLLHIPLGSKHWVEVAEGSKMNYMWMDFFLTKDGEAWLKTHKPIDNNKPKRDTP